MNSKLFAVCFLVLPAAAAAQIPIAVPTGQPMMQRGPMGMPGGYARPVPWVAVPAAPPPNRVEVIPARPGPEHVWQGGHWAWRGGQQVWLPGVWTPPPAPGYGWQPPTWERHERGWRFGEGHWMNAQPAAPTVVYEPPPAVTSLVPMAPPAPIEEMRPVVPFANAVWIPGHWFWNGSHYNWLAGRWSGPRPGAAWEPAHWVQTPAGWRLEQGHWRPM